MTVRITKPEFNLREKISELDKPTGMKGNELLKSETTQEARNYISAGRKNYIINGDFQISQRADYTSATTAANQVYYLDRWTVDVSGVSATIQQKVDQVVGSSSNSYYKNTVKMAATSSASGYLQLRQKVELQKSLYGKTVTVSAWVKSNHPNVRLRIEGGHATGNWDSFQSHSGNGQWEKLSMTVELKANLTALVCGVILWGSTGGPNANHAQGPITNGDYYEFTDFQLELGGNATDFEHRTFAEELLLCQRYLYRLGGLSKAYQVVGTGFIGQNGGTKCAKVVVHLPTTMRTNPTVSVIGTDAFWGHTGAAFSDMACTLTSNQGGTWADASSGNQVWLDFGRSSGGSPDNGTACVVYTQNNNQGEVLFNAEM